MMYLVCLAGSGYHLPAALGARAQEQLPGALTEEYRRSGTIPNSTEKGWRPPQCRAGGKYPAHPSYCGAGIIFAWQEVGRSMDQVAGVQMGTGGMLRASLQQLPAFLSRENNQELGC